MAFVFIQGLTYIYGALYMLLALWITYSRAIAGDGIILRFLVLKFGDPAILSALVYKCADILMLLLIATGASAWLVDMFVRKAREICNNRSTSGSKQLPGSPHLLPLHPLTFVALQCAVVICAARFSVVRADQAEARSRDRRLQCVGQCDASLVSRFVNADIGQTSRMWQATDVWPPWRSQVGSMTDAQPGVCNVTIVSLRRPACR